MFTEGLLCTGHFSNKHFTWINVFNSKTSKEGTSINDVFIKKETEPYGNLGTHMGHTADGWFGTGPQGT